jgi:hypothetical protein
LSSCSRTKIKHKTWNIKKTSVKLWLAFNFRGARVISRLAAEKAVGQEKIVRDPPHNPYVPYMYQSRFD